MGGTSRKRSDPGFNIRTRSEGNRAWIQSSLGDTGTAWEMTNGYVNKVRIPEFAANQSEPISEIEGKFARSGHFRPYIFELDAHER